MAVELLERPAVGLEKPEVEPFDEEPEEDFGSSEGRGTHIATLVHLTDLHLRVGDHLEPSSLKELPWYVRGIRLVPRIGEGVGISNRDAVTHLPKIVASIVGQERAKGGEGLPITVVQTGDVEAHGAVRNEDFRGFRFLRERVQPLLNLLDDAYLGWVDLFGNHDVWSAWWPFTAARKPSERLQQRVATLADRWPEKIERIASQVGPDVRVFRVNSVRETLVGSDWLAGGEVGAHVRDRLTPSAAIAALHSAATSEPTNSLRILLSHHPLVPLTTMSDGTGVVCNSNEVAAWSNPFQLVLVGHKHQLDPVEGATVDCSGAAFQPLGAGIGQLCAESPTQWSEGEDGSDRSISVYRVHHLEDTETFEVHRVLYSMGLIDLGRPKPSELILTGIAGG